ncbi:MAG TPA: helical backbone metal receptor [Fimbriimonadaceae bacterium]|nr:helical backbone metal receptor [Fimbriimonadaceae bacterium]
MRAAWWLSLLLLFSLGGCSSVQRVGGKPAPKLYKKAVSLSPGATEFAALFLRPMKLIGVTESCDYPDSIGNVGVVMKGVKPNYELIADLEPDLVIYDGDLFGADDLSKFKELNIDTYDVGAQTLQEYREKLQRLASMTGSEMMMSDYLSRITAKLDAAVSIKPDAPKRVAVMLPGKGTEHMVAGTESFLADVARHTGGNPVGPKGKLFMPVNAESLIQMDPEVIVVAGTDAQSILSDARLKGITAVKKGLVRRVDPDIALRKGARVDNLVDALSNIMAAAN